MSGSYGGGLVLFSVVCTCLFIIPIFSFIHPSWVQKLPASASVSQLVSVLFLFPFSPQCLFVVPPASTCFLYRSIVRSIRWQSLQVCLRVSVCVRWGAFRKSEILKGKVCLRDVEETILTHPHRGGGGGVKIYLFVYFSIVYFCRVTAGNTGYGARRFLQGVLAFTWNVCVCVFVFVCMHACLCAHKKCVRWTTNCIGR